MNKTSFRNALQQGIHTALDPLVRFFARAGLSPAALTLIGLFLNMIAAGVFIAGAMSSNREALGYIGLAGALILLAGLFDMLDGQLARLEGMASAYGALLDSAVDRYSEIFIFLGICIYFVAHEYFPGALFAFAALAGSLMVSYIRARSEGLGIECKGGFMQRPERIAILGLSGIACGIAGAFPGISGFDAIYLFIVPLAFLAVFANLTAVNRLRHSGNALMQKQKDTI